MSSPPIRMQAIMVIRRKADGHYFYGGKGSSTPHWTPDIALANLVAPTKVRSTIRVDWGRDEEDFEAIEVEPAIRSTE